MIRIDNLTVRFGSAVAVDGFNLQVAAGESFGLVGESGSGKSTVLRTVMGLNRDWSGDIRISGIDVRTGRRQDLVCIAQMVFQDPYASLHPRYTIGEAITEPMRINRIPDASGRTVELLEMIGLTAEHRLRFPHELSGGQRQRVAIGRAISRDPKLFLLDEPLSNLDAALRVGMRLELIKLKQRLKSTMIYVTHDQTEAMTLADRIVVLNKGKIEQQGSPMELFHNPVNRFVASFIGTPAMNFLRVEQATVGNKDHFILGSHTLTMPLKARARTSNKMYLGVRPEHLSLSPENADYEIRGKVFAVEKMGSESFLYLYANDRELVLKCGEDVEVAIGNTIPVYGKLATSHLFEYGGMRISADRPLGKKTVRPASNQ